MATKKVGTVIKEARTAAGLSQEQLARKVAGVSAADIGKVERGEADFTQAQLKSIAKALGVTQASLLNAPKNVSTAKKTSSTTSTAKKTSSTATAKKTGTTAAKKTSSTAKKTSSTSTAKKTSSTAKKTSSTTTAKKTTTPKTPANANSTMKVTSTERKLIEYYRTASSDAKKAATKVLKGEADSMLDSINGKDSVGNVVGNVVTNLLGDLLGGKRSTDEE